MPPSPPRKLPRRPRQFALVARIELVLQQKLMQIIVLPPPRKLPRRLSRVQTICVPVALKGIGTKTVYIAPPLPLPLVEQG
jgi:hypothetical protein